VQHADLLQTLRALEVSLHQHDTRCDRKALGHLLHPRFWEFGRSGAVYTREQTLDEFSEEPPSYRVWSQDFRLELLCETVALLTYKSAHIDPDGQLGRHTHRASNWQLSGVRWLLRFHQGTPAGAFLQDGA
jgi:hypothetical protein